MKKQISLNEFRSLIRPTDKITIEDIDDRYTLESEFTIDTITMHEYWGTICDYDVIAVDYAEKDIIRLTIASPDTHPIKMSFTEHEALLLSDLLTEKIKNYKDTGDSKDILLNDFKMRTKLLCARIKGRLTQELNTYNYLTSDD